MDLRKLTNDELNQKNKILLQKENELLRETLLHIQETDRRKLYLAMGYDSLFAYLTQYCGRSAGSAQRRIDAARLMTAVPEVGKKIAAGELSLSQTSFIQKSVRQKSKDSKIKVSSALKKEIVTKILGKSLPETQVEVAKLLDLDVLTSSKETFQKDGSVRLEVTMTKAQWEKAVEMRELLSSATHSKNWADVLEYLSDRVIIQKRGQRRNLSPRKDEVKSKDQAGEKITATVAVKKEGKRESKSPALEANDNNTHAPVRAKHEMKRKYIPEATRRFVFNRDQCCQYKNKISDKVCGSKWNLQLDHWKPVWAGGSSDLSNLRVLCGKHNRYIYKQQAKIKSI